MNQDKPFWEQEQETAQLAFRTIKKLSTAIAEVAKEIEDEPLAETVITTGLIELLVLKYKGADLNPRVLLEHVMDIWENGLMTQAGTVEKARELNQGITTPEDLKQEITGLEELHKKLEHEIQNLQPRSWKKRD